jgi:hypothetical protein
VFYNICITELHGFMSFFVCFMVYVLCMVSSIALYVLCTLADRSRKSVRVEDVLLYKRMLCQRVLSLSDDVRVSRVRAMDQAHCVRA